jgi:PKD repeat protein
VADAMHYFAKTGIYEVKLTAITAAGCTDSTMMIDTVKSLSAGVYIANAFIAGSIWQGG